MRRALVFLLLLAAAPAAGVDDKPAPCAPKATEVVIDATSRTLFLCRRGDVDASYPVNLGGGGLGKKKQGDRKTPLGRYVLSPPRPSVSGFTWFVPIGYPTAEQRAAGYTGGAIGIHGPPDWLPQALIDVAFPTPWTDGCVMVRTTAEIEAIRAWLLAQKPRVVRLVER